MGEIVYRLLREDEEPQLLQLLQAAFGRWPTIDVPVAPIEHLRWKLDGAAPEARCHCVAELDGTIIAAHVCVLHRFRSAKGPMVGLRSWDAAVHPDYQGRGLIGELRRFLYDEVVDRADFEVGAFTGSPAMRRILDREGRMMLRPAMETTIAPLTLSGAISTLKLGPRRSPAQLARSTAALARWVQSQARPRTPGLAVRPAECFDQRVVRLVEAASARFDFLLERSPALLNWRYADERGGRFEIRVVEEGEQLAGYAVLRTTGGRAYLADLLALPERPDVVETLARDALLVFRRQRATLVRCLIPSAHPYRRILRSCGFAARRKAKEAYSIIPYRASQDELAFLQAPGLRMHLMLGDSDTI